MHDHMIEGPFVATMHMLSNMLTTEFLETMYVYSVGFYFTFYVFSFNLKTARKFNQTTFPSGSCNGICKRIG